MSSYAISLNAMDLLKSYVSDEDVEGQIGHVVPRVDLAPEVLPDVSHFTVSSIGALNYNAKDKCSGEIGPPNPFLSAYQRAPKNSLSGYVERSNVDSFQFENQRRTHDTMGYASCPAGTLVGDLESYDLNRGMSSFERSGVKYEKRARLVNNDASDVANFTGPWAPFSDEQRIAKPSEDEQKQLDEMAVKKEKRNRVTVADEESAMGDESDRSVLHIKDAYDYQGRSFLHIPADIDGVNLHTDDPPVRCYIPKRCVHTFKGHSKAVQKIALFPLSAHLFLTCSMDTKVKLWEFYGQRRCVRTYMGHKQAVRDVCFNNSGESFLSASYDRTIKLWDTERGTVKAKFNCRKLPYCVVFNPSPDRIIKRA